MSSKGVIFVPFCTFVLAGCATDVPKFDIPIDHNTGEPTVKTIEQKIACELASIGTDDALVRKVVDAYDIQAAVQVSLTVTQDGALAPTVAYVDGGFNLGTGFKLEQSREQNFTAQLFYSLQELREQSKSLEWRNLCQIEVDSNLTGVIGLKSNFDLAMTAVNSLKWKEPGNNGVFGGSVTFLVKKDLTATGPNWTLRSFKGPGSFATLANDNNDKIIFSFAKAENKNPKDKARAQAQNIVFINNVITTQLSVSLNSISQTFH